MSQILINAFCIKMLYSVTKENRIFSSIHGIFIKIDYILSHKVSLTLPSSSARKGFACNAGDPSLIPGSGRSPGEGIGFPLQYSWASLEAQIVKNPPAMWETWVPSLGWEDPLEEEMATHSSILAWRFPWTEEPGGLQSMKSQRVGHNGVTKDRGQSKS